MIPRISVDDIFCRGGRTGQKIHRSTPGSSVLRCGHWLKCDAARFAVRPDVVDRLPLARFCEHCFPELSALQSTTIPSRS